MFDTLKQKNLESFFIQKLIDFTKLSTIEDWFLIYENLYTAVDHNGTITLDCLYVLTDPQHKDIGIFFSQSDNSLEISRSFQLIAFQSALEGNININSHHKSIIIDKVKYFQSQTLNDKLSIHLPVKNYSESIKKI